MTFLSRHLLAATIAVLLASAATFAFARPGPTACLLIGLAGLHTLPDGTLTDSVSEADQQHYVQLTRAARARIEATFGATESKPIVVFFGNRDGIGPFKLNSYGSTQFIGSRACVMIGPNGQNNDVIAHELMHGELYHRVGYLRYFLEVPTWFDEGVAMQVDYRDRYLLSPQDSQNSGYVQRLTTASSFFVSDDEALTRNYAAAKTQVDSWLGKVGATVLYPRLQRLRDGASFSEVFPERELTDRSSGLPSAAAEL